MKRIPGITSSWGDLYDLARIGTQSTIFLKAIEWKIFDYLTAIVPASTVAANMKSHPRTGHDLHAPHRYDDNMPARNREPRRSQEKTDARPR